jgi:hypothetical protein
MYTKLSRCLLLGGALICGARVAIAQDPVRLPGVVVKAPIEKPGPRALAGVARDTFAIPIDSVEISIPDLKRRAITGGDGKFHFDKVAPGTYDVRARKIGYAPQVREVTVDADGGVGLFEMLQLQRALPPMIVSAARGGIGGVVGDTSFRAVPGAIVRLVGKGLAVAADSSGYFHFDVEAGQYFLTVKQDGFKDKVVSVRVPPDSGRRVSIFLEPRSGDALIQSHWNVDDMAERVALRTKTNSSVYAREDLIDMGVEWVGDVVQGGFTRAISKTSLLDRDCVGILNGGPETVMLKTLTIDDVASIEIYAPSMVQSQRALLAARPQGKMVGKSGVADSRVIMPFLNAERAGMQNAALNCAVVYVWTR